MPWLGCSKNMTMVVQYPAPYLLLIAVVCEQSVCMVLPHWHWQKFVVGSPNSVKSMNASCCMVILFNHINAGPNLILISRQCLCLAGEGGMCRENDTIRLAEP